MQAVLRRSILMLIRILLYLCSAITLLEALICVKYGLNIFESVDMIRVAGWLLFQVNWLFSSEHFLLNSQKTNTFEYICMNTTCENHGILNIRSFVSLKYESMIRLLSCNYSFLVLIFLLFSILDGDQHGNSLLYGDDKVKGMIEIFINLFCTIVFFPMMLFFICI